MNKTLSKAIMHRTKLRNKFLKNRSAKNKSNYTKKRNLCVTLLRKSKREYYGNLNEKLVCDNKKFWKTVKPLLSNKTISNKKITLVENGNIIRNECDAAKVFNSFFTNVVKNLEIPQYNINDQICKSIQDPLIQAVVRFRKHPSIIAIEKNCNANFKFNFFSTSKDEILKEIASLNTSKATHDTDVPTKIIKENADIFAEFLCSNFNKSIQNSVFP